jgi:pilus assembly protein FimV
MSLRLNRASLLLVLLLAGDAWALGLGEIRLSSALNEPLRAEIQLMSTTPEELAGLRVELASAATFERYGIDRPHFLTRLDFDVVDANQPGGDVVRITSNEPITEPFVTFLVEASWPGGRLLREYTVLLDPPTFAPPPTAQAPQAVTAPQRQQQADSGRIERPAAPSRQSAADTEPFDQAAGGDVRVQRGDTLWQIAERVRPDNRLSMNQVMLAIFDANPQAFAGNINRLTAGATLRIPSADDIFRINRADAMSEVQRHYADWGAAGTGRAQPSLTLVPPDGDQPQYEDGASPAPAGATDAATEARIRELERMVEDQRSLIEIRDSELASLREELARLRAESLDAAAAAGEEASVPADEPFAADEAAEDADQVFADDEAAPETADEAADEAAEAAPAPAEARPAPTVAATPGEPGLVDRVIGVLTGFWGILGIVLVLVIGILLWLAKRAAGTSGEDSTGVWETLDDEEIDSESRASTERLRALARDDDSAIVVVEQESSPGRRKMGDTQEISSADAEAGATAETGVQPTLEDTFSSETAINLDQSDPIAEADFHMAYGLYDQAADLVNGALAAEPERQDLMAKLCEIYFVWGNKDAFVEAAGRLHDQLGGEATPDWDKTVIMGQQIAPDHRLFSGAAAEQRRRRRAGGSPPTSPRGTRRWSRSCSATMTTSRPWTSRSARRCCCPRSPRARSTSPPSRRP